MKSSKVSILILSLFVCYSCDGGGKGERQLSDSKGQPAELLVVLPSALVNSEVADTLETITDCDAPGLGSSERIFRTMTIGERGYQKVYKLMHSQLHVQLDSKQTQPMLGVAYDVYARPQLQIMIKAASQQSMIQYLSQNRERIQHLILDFQLNRYANILKKKYSKKVDEDLARHMGYRVCMPVDMASTKLGKNFLWGSSNRGGDKDINFVFYTLPWQGQEVTDTAYFVRMRDSVMQANIPGGQPGQYMQTSRGEYGQPVLWPMLRRIDGRELMEVRGLWDMHAGFMGGPFVSRVEVDTAARQVIFSEGFVFSPNTSKRDLLRSVEAGLRTLRRAK